MNDDQELISKLLEGNLDESEWIELRERLKSDSAFADKVGAHFVIEGLLGPAMEDEFTAQRNAQRAISAVRDLDGREFAAGVRESILQIRNRRRASWAAAAAVVVAGLFLWMGGPEPVATIERLGAVDSDTGYSEGMKFSKGDRLTIETGLVELKVGTRGRMVVEGPADLEWSGPMGAVLHEGRILMKVTPEGHGYRVETPRGSVIDLGTEFGVSVDQTTGDVETHVLDGEVNAITMKGETIHLAKHDALRFDDDDGERIPADFGSFYASLPPSHNGDTKMVHWPMELESGGLDRAEIAGFDAGQFDLVFKAMDAGGPPEMVEGVFGSAVHFDGKGSYAESGFEGIGGRDPRTVCFWVKVPSDFNAREGFAMVSWGKYAESSPGDVWQISVNPLEQSGPVGRLRVGTHGGQAVGSSDLRDDQWHHVAVVLYESSTPDVGKHVMMYLDGNLEAITTRTLREIHTKVEDANHGVWIGRNVTYVRTAPMHQHGGFFRGGVDEVYIFNAALSQEEIRELMRTNKPPR